ncbi:MAG: pilus assembly protein PilP [Pseudomarimonas sp.]
MSAHSKPASKMKRSIRYAAILAAMTLAGGCTHNNADLQSYVAEVKLRPGPPLDPLPVMRQFETFEYKAYGLRDPFSVQTDEEEEAGSDSDGLRPDPNRRRELLESFPLDGLSMVGTLGEGESMVALVVDPAAVIHRVVAGNYLGQNEGRVLAISEGEISLLELVSDGAGGWIERQASVALDEK